MFTVLHIGRSCDFSMRAIGETLEEVRESVQSGRRQARELENVLLPDMLWLLHVLQSDHMLSMDLKPENIILSPRGLVLVDHGFDASTDSLEFKNGSRLLARGTPLFLPQKIAEYVTRLQIRSTFWLSVALSMACFFSFSIRKEFEMRVENTVLYSIE